MEILPTSNFQPDIVLMGLRLGEPVIAFTSLLVSLVCFYAWKRLGKLGSTEDALRLSRIFFLLTGFSTLIGGLIGHAFLYAVPFEFKLPGWMFGMIAVSALQQASVVRTQSLTGAFICKALLYQNIIGLTLALWFISTSLWFPVVEIHGAIGFLLVVTPLEFLSWVKKRAAGSLEILWGILLLVAAVLAHILKISIGVWFSFFDIGHVFMCAAMWKIMLGVEKNVLEGLSTTAESGALSQSAPE